MNSAAAWCEGGSGSGQTFKRARGTAQRGTARAQSREDAEGRRLTRGLPPARGSSLAGYAQNHTSQRPCTHTHSPGSPGISPYCGSEMVPALLPRAAEDLHQYSAGSPATLPSVPAPVLALTFTLGCSTHPSPRPFNSPHKAQEQRSLCCSKTFAEDLGQ